MSWGTEKTMEAQKMTKHFTAKFSGHGCMYWGITIFTNFDVRVGEKRQFLSVSKKHEF